jgi:precorrin-2 dehydrogenase/sirohydrochlorin ferrochelatase
MIPLFVDCTGRRIVIFGGGAVAARKAAYFAREADVLVLSRSFVQKLETLPVERKTMDIEDTSDAGLIALIANAFLVIAALSDTAQNNRIGKLCRRKRVLFNNADGEAGDVVLPAVSRGANYTLAISTGGSSPAISRYIREHLDREVPELDAMITLQRRLREELKRTEPDQARRTAILHKVLEDPSVWKLLIPYPDKAWEKVSARYLDG